MKRKTLKTILPILFAIIIIVGVLWFANNANKTAEEQIQAQAKVEEERSLKSLYEELKELLQESEGQLSDIAEKVREIEKALYGEEYSQNP